MYSFPQRRKCNEISISSCQFIFDPEIILQITTLGFGFLFFFLLYWLMWVCHWEMDLSLLCWNLKAEIQFQISLFKCIKRMMRLYWYILAFSLLLRHQDSQVPTCMNKTDKRTVNNSPPSVFLLFSQKIC